MTTYTLRQLRQMGKEQNIKNTSQMNTKTLCELLNIPLVRNQIFDKCNKDKITKPVCIHFVNWFTGEKELEFPSIYKAAKYLGVNPSCIPFYIKKQKTIKLKLEKGELLCSVKRK